MTSFSRSLLTTGVVYFLILTTVNAFNVLVYLGAQTVYQSAAASLAQAATLVMSQRLIMSVHGA